MSLIVCVKHVPDTAAKITIKNGNQIDESINFVINPYDEYAVEEATLLKDKEKSELIAVSVGTSEAEKTLRIALAMGADRSHLVKTTSPLDPNSTALALAEVIKKESNVEVIFMGKVTVDSEGMQTHYRLAEILNMPIVTDIVKFEKKGDTVIVEREMGGGSLQVVELKTPCIVAASIKLNKPKYPKLPNIMKAKKKEVKEIDFASLGISSKSSTVIEKLTLPNERTGAKMVDGATPEEKIQNLIKILKEDAKVL